MKTDSELADLFAAFAHPTRIAILRALLACAQAGRQFGDLAQALEAAPSTLTHHLNEMERAGVLIRQPEGRATRLRLNLVTLTEAVSQLTRLCCAVEIPSPDLKE